MEFNTIIMMSSFMLCCFLIAKLYGTITTKRAGKLTDLHIVHIGNCVWEIFLLSKCFFDFSKCIGVIFTVECTYCSRNPLQIKLLWSNQETNLYKNKIIIEISVWLKTSLRNVKGKLPHRPRPPQPPKSWRPSSKKSSNPRPLILKICLVMEQHRRLHRHPDQVELPSPVRFWCLHLTKKQRLLLRPKISNLNLQVYRIDP